MKTVATLLLASTAVLAAGCNCNKCRTQAAQGPPAAQATTQSQQTASESDFVGLRGPDGPAGARGAQGATGETGPAGRAVAGIRGPAGPTGPAGRDGPAGERGVAGAMTRGQTGEAGPAGVAGAQGPAGQTGVRGASAEGTAGAAGATGPIGPTGAAGPAGEPGATLVGPPGQAGRAGPAGERGLAGEAGAAGATTPGIAGVAGVPGPAGPRGAVGPIGPIGPSGLVENWASFRDFYFDPDETAIHDADRYLVRDIAAYMTANPSLELAIDGSTNPRATTQPQRDLCDNRVNGIRESLIAAGVPASRISDGLIGNKDQRRVGRAEVLLRTDRHATAQATPANPVAAAELSDWQVSPTGKVENWTTLQSFWFESTETDIHLADRAKVEEIAAYMERNPSLELGIDSTPSASASPNWADGDLAERRAECARDALIAAGVPTSRIQTGTFADPSHRRTGRVELLIRTDRLAASR
jgi:outer membrane protein OmpA-like peptidoglycan-associated protein